MKSSAVVVGAGIGGLSAAIDLSSQGIAVTLLEAGPAVGGKMRALAVGQSLVDSGPTVLTMRDVFERLFAESGARLEDYVTLRPLDVLARHVFADGTRLDLFADEARTERAIEAFAGAAELARFREFRAYARGILEVSRGPFIEAEKPTLGSLLGRVLGTGLGALSRVDGHRSMARAIAAHLRDPRLVMLYARYATYCGGSPYECPATLNLVSEVEAEGVCVVEGGMQRLAEALERRARELGVVVRTGARVEAIEAKNKVAMGVRLASSEVVLADAVVLNADTAALAAGLLGREREIGVDPVYAAERSLSALTFSVVARPRGLETSEHTVFFSPDYVAEMDDLLRLGRVPRSPSVYVCDQGPAVEDGCRKYFVIVNAPATGDRPAAWSEEEVSTCTKTTFDTLSRMGLSLEREATVVTTPADFERRFPRTGGALYGKRPTGPLSFFLRPGARSGLGRLYFAGGSVHPGPGVPMAARSGRFAARAVLEDLGSTAR